ncbi:RNA polymerase sigma factor [Marivita sp. S2033]|uniref:RNA polymerase sigma factor n=1 Tax=Marivita sp. S2033 TaxID=3373187 RepID=UPI0039829C19
MVHSASTLHFQRSFDTVRRARHPLQCFRDPAALLDRLHRGSGNPEDKNVILSALVEVAQRDELASDCALTLLLLALWPGLDAIRRRSIWQRIGTADEITSDILARSTEAIRGVDLDRVNRIAATILRNIERDMIRARQRESARQSLRSETDPDEIPIDAEMLHGTASHGLLHGDLVRIIGTDAALVIRVAIEGFSQAEAAIELGLSEAAGRKRYQRAMQKLREALQEIS